ncbi:MAG: ABC transporter ATP-binding protein [Clostridium sp.]|uniref:ABC transporter ATP-binding protein n=1 Tax=Clostridium sp. TaxID=1506 RepID=UPI0029109226|nr:ABC transporter ATP-binding protein [Clostridium sp.]MDU5111381.1 ABC transporter ATP-binding protein [Clostridium sp.]
MINIKDLTIKYNKEVAINNLSLSIEKGKSYAIIGKSGCGKTTLLYTMAGLISNYEGKLEIEGETSLILQNLGLFNWFTVYKNISLGLNKSNLSKEEKEKVVNKIINELGLADLKDKYPKELSGGQKQRVAIGRTIINNPEILLLDEATSALDSINKEMIQELLLEIKIEKNITMILVTHNIEEAVFLGEEIIVMKDGKIDSIIPNKYFGDKDIRSKNEYIEICNKVRGSLYD